MWCVLVFCSILCEAQLVPPLDRIHTKADIVVTLRHAPHRRLSNISDALQHLHPRARAQLVHRHLQDHATTTQIHLHRMLRAHVDHYEGPVRVLWISNQVAIPQASRHLMEQLIAHDDIASIHLDEAITLDKAPAVGPHRHLEGHTLPWNLAKVGAPRVWALGNRGEGSIAGIIDSGFYLDHDEVARSRILAWKDVVQQRPTPYDDMYHGTHVTATAVGTHVGMAPAASVVLCKAFNARGILSSRVTECAQFMICPHGQCEDTPDVINNSWTFLTAEGASFRQYAQAWKAAGIASVFCTGNNFRPFVCSDVQAKAPSTLPSTIGVGATTMDDALAYFSRQGAVDLVAPGAAIPSAHNQSPSSYMDRDGTSMSAPHVTGAILLMKTEARKRGKVLDVDTILSILQRTADVQLRPPQFQCEPTHRFPNSAYGAGRLNVHAAVLAVRQL